MPEPDRRSLLQCGGEWILALSAISPYQTFYEENSLYALLVLVLLLLSGITSGYETAFFALSKEEIDKIYRKNKLSFTEFWILRFHKKPQQFIATLLITNNFINIGIVVLSTFILADLKKIIIFEEWVWRVIDLVVITFVILMVGEITPKVYGSYSPRRYVNIFTFIIRGQYALFYPLSWSLERLTGLFYRPVSSQEHNLSVDELKHAIDLTSESDSPKEEKQILKALVNLNAIPVRTIMRARVDVKAIEYNVKLETVVKIIAHGGYSRLPIYEENLDNIKGILHIKDLLPVLDKPNIDWHTYLRPAFFVPETKKIGKLLNELKEKKLHIAIVVDEFGGTAGIVTLEDILEEIFGEIGDDISDKGEIIYSKLSNTEYVFEGKMPLIDICKIMQLDEEIFSDAASESERLGGFILELVGSFPGKGEIVSYKNLDFHIESVTNTHIKRVKIILHPAKPLEYVS